jgi:hypothetical protein
VGEVFAQLPGQQMTYFTPQFPYGRTECDHCGSAHWSVLGTCECCGRRCCDQCEGAETIDGRLLVCAACMRDIAEVFDKIRPQFFDAILDLIEGYQLPEREPVSIECFRAIVECKSVGEVQETFLKFVAKKAAQSESGTTRKENAA